MLTRYIFIFIVPQRIRENVGKKYVVLLLLSLIIALSADILALRSHNRAAYRMLWNGAAFASEKVRRRDLRTLRPELRIARMTAEGVRFRRDQRGWRSLACAIDIARADRNAINAATLFQLAHQIHARPPPSKLRVIIDAEGAIAAGRIFAELTADPLPTEDPASDAMTRKQDAKETGVEMKVAGVGATR